MSELLAAAAVIAPFVSTAATSFAGAVVDAARDRLADSAVERGRRLLGAVLHRGSGDPPLTGEDAAAATAIEELPPREREILESAIGDWLTDGDDLSARSLTHSIRTVHSEYRAGDRTYVASYGENSPAIGHLGSATFHFHRGPDGGTD
ncbi:hypothetical protein AMK21_30945 [Streptomyces sp. CB00316]|uniref:hypothetical protein n=1 Tax=unclassified Streptomyces TaxID=2593676 RepID=UPI00093F29AC|nr:MULTISPECIES: hypothetical protein [unclassified Streptomyces]MBT2380777.1 hypothetical protein [Streptomyces sp. ISL-111]MBT2429587.1 hypothetical protein [Streptomyces sp. ISL-112]MBT2462782.1 hypothetical protein [Streptomyces sp. ISL-63]OKJ10050.1 hypothetical protein AMK21_30945 [Streptomyces sp. CB00316]